MLTSEYFFSVLEIIQIVIKRSIEDEISALADFVFVWLRIEWCEHFKR